MTKKTKPEVQDLHIYSHDAKAPEAGIINFTTSEWIFMTTVVNNNNVEIIQDNLLTDGKIWLNWLLEAYGDVDVGGVIQEVIIGTMLIPTIILFDVLNWLYSCKCDPPSSWFPLGETAICGDCEFPINKDDLLCTECEGSDCESLIYGDGYCCRDDRGVELVKYCSPCAQNWVDSIA